MVKRYQTPLAIFLFLRVGFSLNARGLKVLFVQGYFCKAAGNEKKCLLLQLLSYADTSNR